MLKRGHANLMIGRDIFCRSELLATLMLHVKMINKTVRARLAALIATSVHNDNIKKTFIDLSLLNYTGE